MNKQEVLSLTQHSASILLAQCTISCRACSDREPLLSLPLHFAGVNSNIASFWPGRNANPFLFFLVKSITFSSHSKLQYQLNIITSLASQARHTCTRVCLHHQARAPPLIRVTDRLTDDGRIVCVPCRAVTWRDVTESVASSCYFDL
jgi:hypothetical protein